MPYFKRNSWLLFFIFNPYIHVHVYHNQCESWWLFALLQSVREDGELQVWTIDKGLLISSVSVGVQVCVAMKSRKKPHKLVIIHLTISSSCTVHANAGRLSVGPVSSLLSHGACGCGGDSQWSCLLCGSDLPKET